MVNFKNTRCSKYIKYALLLPGVITLAAAFFSYANVDSIRDIIEAQRINSGTGWVLLGPQMAFSFYIGPWWFYLLSMVSGTEYSWLFTSLITAVLNLLKYFIVYQLGLRLGGVLLARLMVIGLLLLSFSLMQIITFTHTNLVETMMLLIIYLSYQERHLSYKRTFLIGCMVGLAIHAHPTAIAAGFYTFVKWLNETDKLKKAGLVLLGFSLVFLPLIINEFITNYEQTIGATHYLENKTNGFNFFSFLKVIAGVIFVSPYAMLMIIMNSYWALFFTVVQSLILLLSLIFPLLIWKTLDKKVATFVWQGWLFLVLYVLGVVLIRENTPWYLTYGFSLVVSLLVAVGLFLMYQNYRYRLIVIISSIWLLIVYLLVQINFIVHLNNGEIVVPSNSLNDVKSFNSDLSGSSYEIIAHQSKNHGEFTCLNSPIGLHGPYSQLIFSHSAVEHLSNCDDSLMYGTVDGASDVIGVPPEYAKLITQEAFETIGNTSFYYPVDISENQKMWVESFDHDYERTFDFKKNWKDETIQTTLNGGNNLLITRLLGFRMSFEVVAVWLGDKELMPIRSRSHSVLYICNECDAKNNSWTIHYKESITGMTNIVSF